MYTEVPKYVCKYVPKRAEICKKYVKYFAVFPHILTPSTELRLIISKFEAITASLFILGLVCATKGRIFKPNTMTV